jgi:alpha-tubulin suppressor-like RCC1 family protein
VALPPAVKLTNAHGQAVGGLPITFAVGSGGGSITAPAGGAGTAVGVIVRTAGNGVAALASWMLGSSPGTNTVAASETGALGSPLTFTATGTVASITFAMVTTGGVHNCGLTVGGTAFCWGADSTGELGNNATSNSPVPVLVAGGLSFSLVSPGRDGPNANHTCGVTTAGSAYCWGDNRHGQLGNNTTTESHVPVAVAGGLTFSSVSSGQFHTCGLTPGGAAYCWGANSSGQLGTNSTTDSHVPVAVAGGLTFSSLSSGAEHACALTAGGVAYCWGANYTGQLGNNSTTNSLVPVAVVGGLTFSSVSSGGFHSCGLTTGGLAYCWGVNYRGELGNGSTVGNSPVPVKVAYQP